MQVPSEVTEEKTLHFYLILTVGTVERAGRMTYPQLIGGA